MKILMISLDGSILEPESESFRRMMDYGSICNELHIIVLGASGKENRNKNVFVHSTSSSRLLSLFSAYKIGKKILERNGWIITSQDPFEAGFVAWRLAKKIGLSFEVQLHGDFYGNNFWKKERLINQLRFFLGKFILTRADGVRVVSERIKKSISNFAKGKIYGISVRANAMNGGDAHFLKNKFPGAYPIIISVGNLVRVKNHQFLLEVFAEIKKKLSKAKLVIAGDGPLKKNYELQITNYKLQNDVWLAGHQKNLADFYASADIFVHLSLDEGWGRAAIEAAAFGLPIVMTDVGLASEIIKNNESGIIIPVNDGTALKDAIIKLAGDEMLRKSLGQGAKRAVSTLPDNNEYLDKIKEAWLNIVRV